MMKKSVFVVAAALVAGVLVAAPVKSITPVPQTDDPNSWWQKRHAEKVQLAKAGGSEVVFIGDSIVHGLEGSAVWRERLAVAPYKALNLGFGADRTEHVLWRLNHGELDGFKAKVVVLMIGTNNTGHRARKDESPADTILGVNEVITKIRERQPKAKIILHPIFPRGETVTDEKRQRNESVNVAIRQLADNQNVFWCDFNDSFLKPDGTLTRDMMGDLLHPTPKGQALWADAVIPVINRLLRLPEETRPRAARAIPRRMHEYVWRLKDRRHLAMDGKDGGFDLVFLGDSIMHAWDYTGREVFDRLSKDYKILNLGFSGDRTEHLIWRFENGELEGYKTKMFMLMIGTNNSADSAEDVAAGIKRIIEVTQEKQPGSKLLLLPIFPRSEKGDAWDRKKNNRTNEIIKNYADGQNVFWCDFTDQFVEGPEKIIPRSLMPDLLHPNLKGYEIWEAAVRPIFKQVLGK